jgi:hypothetical protein
MRSKERTKQTTHSPDSAERTDSPRSRVFVFIPLAGCDSYGQGGRESERSDEWKTRGALAGHVQPLFFFGACEHCCKAAAGIACGVKRFVFTLATDEITTRWAFTGCWKYRRVHEDSARSIWESEWGSPFFPNKISWSSREQRDASRYKDASLKVDLNNLKSLEMKWRMNRINGR